MSAKTRIRTAWHLLRHGDLPADVRARIADEIAEDDQFVDELLDDFRSHLYARATVRAGQPRLTLVGGAS